VFRYGHGERILSAMSNANAQRDQNPEFVHQTFSSIASRYVMTNHFLCAGIDIIWRKKVASIVAAVSPKFVLDVATGSGDLARAVQKRVPQAKVIGSDFCEPMLAEAKKRGLEDLVVADGLALPFSDNSFDAVTIGYGLRNMADWSAALQEFARVLRPGGKLVVLDFSLPRNRALLFFYRFYLHKILPRIAGWLTGNKEAYAYLGDSIERFPSGTEMRNLIDKNGFSESSWFPQLCGISSVYAASADSPHETDK
jgi:demethylmenaquinone methyltransferase/2-methoxy-6-polyprenyl-1,4-benzoquinol methylase